MTVKPSVPSQAVGEFYQQLKFYTLFLMFVIEEQQKILLVSSFIVYWN